MKKKQLTTQIALVLIGSLLFALTYLYYPSMDKDKLLKEESFEKTADKDQATFFTNIEYKGLYDLDKPFKIRSEKAYILDEEPDVVYMNKMHIILYLSDGRVVNIISDKGRYNKVTQDCFFEQNVEATDGSTKIFAENLDLMAAKNSVEIYNNVSLDNVTSYLRADKINYNFETKYFKVSMFDDKTVKMKVIK